VDFVNDYAGTPLMDYFGITVASTGPSAAVDHITGETDSFAEGLSFDYLYGDTPDFSVDEITPLGATPVFRSVDNIVRVTSYLDREARTIASSIIFGALYDSDEHSKAELMNYYLRFLIPPTANEEEVIPYPNPFNPSTTISFSLPAALDFSLKIYDLRGKLITTLADGRGKTGKQEFVWDGQNSNNSPVASGVYFARLKSGSYIKTTKLTLLK
jgi:hypothetical protein